jgi:indole-3-glycerol phosphate synthase
MVRAGMELPDWTAARTQRLRRLGAAEVSGLMPSARDFIQAVSTHRSALAVIAELARATPEEGVLDPALDVEKLCRLANEAAVSALAVATDPILCQGDDLLLASASRLFEGPLLMRDLVVGRDQLYGARLLGADAVLLTAAALPASELKACIEIAGSMHMATPVEVASGGELTVALAAAARVVVIPAFKGSALHLALADDLLPKVPRNVVAIVRGPFATPEDLTPLRGRADALWLAAPLYAPGAEERLRQLVDAAENG